MPSCYSCFNPHVGCVNLKCWLLVTMLKQCFKLIMLVKFPMFGTCCWFCCCCCYCCCCFCCCRCCCWCCSWSYVCSPPHHHHHQSEPFSRVTPMPFVFWLPPCVGMISLGYCNGCCSNPSVVDLISMLCLLVQSHVWLIKSHMYNIYIYTLLYVYINILYMYTWLSIYICNIYIYVYLAIYI